MSRSNVRPSVTKFDNKQQDVREPLINLATLDESTRRFLLKYSMLGGIEEGQTRFNQSAISKIEIIDLETVKRTDKACQRRFPQPLGDKPRPIPQ